MTVGTGFQPVPMVEAGFQRASFHAPRETWRLGWSVKIPKKPPSSVAVKQLAHDPESLLIDE